MRKLTKNTLEKLGIKKSLTRPKVRQGTDYIDGEFEL